jgi:hypothetical protein
MQTCFPFASLRFIIQTLKKCPSGTNSPYARFSPGVKNTHRLEFPAPDLMGLKPQRYVSPFPLHRGLAKTAHETGDLPNIIYWPLYGSAKTKQKGAAG